MHAYCHVISDLALSASTSTSPSDTMQLADEACSTSALRYRAGKSASNTHKHFIAALMEDLLLGEKQSFRPVRKFLLCFKPALWRDAYTRNGLDSHGHLRHSINAVLVYLVVVLACAVPAQDTKH